MKTDPFVIEHTYKASVERLWKALTEPEELKQWYFDIPTFMPVTGFEFEFLSGPHENKKYLHVCKVLEVVPYKKIAYSWRYEGYDGNSLVTFDLIGEKDVTRLKLTHEGLHTFPVEEPDFSLERFAEGWTWIIGTALRLHVEKPISRPSSQTINFEI